MELSKLDETNNKADYSSCVVLEAASSGSGRATHLVKTKNIAKPTENDIIGIDSEKSESNLPNVSHLANMSPELKAKKQEEAKSLNKKTDIFVLDANLPKTKEINVSNKRLKKIQELCAWILNKATWEEARQIEVACLKRKHETKTPEKQQKSLTLKKQKSGNVFLYEDLTGSTISPTSKSVSLEEIKNNHFDISQHTLPPNVRQFLLNNNITLPEHL